MSIKKEFNYGNSNCTSIYFLHSDCYKIKELKNTYSAKNWCFPTTLTVEQRYT